MSPAARVTIPSDAVVLLMGAAGSGKSTFAEKSFFPSEILSSDALREIITSDPTNQRYNSEVFAFLHDLLGLRAKQGLLTVVDATNVMPNARKTVREIAALHGRPVAVLVMNTSLEDCHLQNAKRQRRVPADVINRHYAQFSDALTQLDAEGYWAVDFIDGRTDVVVQPKGGQIHEAPGFDIIGDVHGCIHELAALITDLGYFIDEETETARHPDGRKLVFVGDLTDRGPENVAVLSAVEKLVKDGHICVRGNHDDKLRRALAGNKVKAGHGLQETLQELQKATPEDRARYLKFLEQLPFQVQLVVPGVRQGVVVAHAGMARDLIGRDNGPARQMALYGQVEGFQEDGLPIRSEYWRAGYHADSAPWVVFGHTPRREADIEGSSVCIDTGCVFGGKLTAFRYPEISAIAILADKAYDTSRTELQHARLRGAAA